MQVPALRAADDLHKSTHTSTNKNKPPSPLLQEVVDVGYLNGLFVLARSIGLIGELLQWEFRAAAAVLLRFAVLQFCGATGGSRERRICGAGVHPPSLPCHTPCTWLGCLSANLLPPLSAPLTLPLQAMRSTRSACSSRCSGTPGTRCCTPSEVRAPQFVAAAWRSAASAGVGAGGAQLAALLPCFAHLDSMHPSPQR